MPPLDWQPVAAALRKHRGAVTRRNFKIVRGAQRFRDGSPTVICDMGGSPQHPQTSQGLAMCVTKARAVGRRLWAFDLQFSKCACLEVQHLAYLQGWNMEGVNQCKQVAVSAAKLRSANENSMKRPVVRSILGKLAELV